MLLQLKVIGCGAALLWALHSLSQYKKIKVLRQGALPP